MLDRRVDKNASTGLFELAFKQPPVVVPAYIGVSLSVEGQLVKRPTHAAVKNSHAANSLQNARVPVVEVTGCSAAQKIKPAIVDIGAAGSRRNSRDDAPPAPHAATRDANCLHQNRVRDVGKDTTSGSSAPRMTSPARRKTTPNDAAAAAAGGSHSNTSSRDRGVNLVQEHIRLRVAGADQIPAAAASTTRRMKTEATTTTTTTTTTTNAALSRLSSLQPSVAGTTNSTTTTTGFALSCRRLSSLQTGVASTTRTSVCGEVGRTRRKLSCAVAADCIINNNTHRQKDQPTRPDRTRPDLTKPEPTKPPAEPCQKRVVVVRQEKAPSDERQSKNFIGHKLTQVCTHSN